VDASDRRCAGGSPSASSLAAMARSDNVLDNLKEGMLTPVPDREQRT
jgi:hypothetical protein